MKAAEIELKFPVDDIQSLRARIDGTDLELETERTFEANTLYDTPERTLREKKQILRLRTYGARCTLTHKRKTDAEDAKYKTRMETETELTDFDAMEEVFAQLGYFPAFRYEKFRTEWKAEGGGHLVLDETPIGVWAELEGAPEWIDRMLEVLAVDPDRCMTDSYGKLFLGWCERTGCPATNMTFAEVSEAVPA